MRKAILDIEFGEVLRARRVTPVLALVLLTPVWMGAQSVTAQASAPEVASSDESPSFKARVNLVVVPVIARDAHGQVITTLKKEDFQLFDKGKPQVITRFSIEKPGAAVAPKSDAVTESTLDKMDDKPAAGRADVPDHFIAYLFDDVHLQFGDLVHVRDAAGRHMDKALRSTDRAAVFTTSGRVTVDFTDDHARLHEALTRLRVTPIARGLNACPDVSYYMADLITNRNDAQALQAATADAMQCLHMDPSTPGAAQIAQQAARTASSMMISAGDQETHVSYTVIRDVIRRISYMPGQKTIILVSPGFFTNPDHRSEESDVLEKALRANVVISALDARGLYTPPLFDASQANVNPATMTLETQYASASATAEGDVLAELAYGTGGTFFQNNNDYDEGFRKVAATPECIYMLGFSPEKLKFDGTFHTLKVKLAAGLRFDLQARKGYYAPKHLTDAGAAAKEEIEEAVFSREEMHDLPVDLNTQFFRVSDTAASLSVLARVNLRQLHYRKAEGRNLNELTLVAALFDRDGNYVKGGEKTVTMRLRDETLAKVPSISVKTSFDVPPGHYVVRLVMRDAEGHMMTAETRAVEISF